MNRSFLNRGQSLIELAIFASVIFLAMSVLISYGLSFNYNQQVTLTAFRKAIQLAKQVANTSLYASVNLVYDKAIANPASMFGISPRSPIAVSASGAWSNELYSELDGDDEELPRTVYNINGKVYSLKTAAFVHKGLDQANAKRRAYIEGWDGTGPAWQWEYPDKKENSFGSNTSWDIDGDDEEETIIKLKTGLVMDSQEGELDMTIDDPQKRNGLISDYKSTVIDKSALTNLQKQGKFESATKLDYLQIIERRIRLNPGEGVDFSALLGQINKNNQNCYGRGSPCEAEEEDYILEEDGDKYLVVRSRFMTKEDSYVWSTE